jgi:hypothetical protein
MHVGGVQFPVPPKKRERKRKETAPGKQRDHLGCLSVVDTVTGTAQRYLQGLAGGKGALPSGAEEGGISHWLRAVSELRELNGESS